MSGYKTILKCEQLKERADQLGFMLCYPQNSYNADYVAIKPKDQDALPIYARDTQLFCGTIDDLECFFKGIEWARNYDYMLRVSDTKKRERKEQDVRNRKLLQALKNSEKDKESVDN